MINGLIAKKKAQESFTKQHKPQRGGTPAPNHRKAGKQIMIETVAEIKGYKVQRHIGTRGHYFVNVREGKGFREFHTFKTKKAAIEFIEKAL